MGLTFDNNGYLTPYEVIETDLKTFRYTFVENRGDAKHRSYLFDNYLNYIKELSEVISPMFFQWINGSFVTNKQKPRDIDLVSFVDFSLFKGNEEKLKSFVYPYSRENYNVDAYIVKVYPESNKNHIYSKSDFLYWYHHFQKTRPNRNGDKQYKGFIKINLNNENI